MLLLAANLQKVFALVSCPVLSESILPYCGDGLNVTMCCKSYYYYTFAANAITFCRVSSVFCSSFLAETKPVFSTCQ